jgi:hypothetical protein
VAETSQKTCLYAAGFGTLSKRWDKCISVGGGYVEINVFSRFEYRMFYVYLFPTNFVFTALPRTNPTRAPNGRSSGL